MPTSPVSTPGGPGGGGSGTGGSGGGSGSGSGSGSGAVQVSFSTTTYSGNNLLWNNLLRPTGTVRADLNGDGREDFVTSGFCPGGSNGTFSVRLSTGDGAYGTPTCYTIPTAPLVPISFAAGDLFGNGHIGVLVQDEKGNLSIWNNANGDGKLTLGSSMALPGGEGGILTADVNHDGKTDLVYYRADMTTGKSGTLTVFFGNGEGTFTTGPSTSITTQVGLLEEAAGDFDGDGNIDIAVSDTSGEETEILYGDGTGKFTPGPAVGGGAVMGVSSAVLTQYGAFKVDSGGTTDLIGAPFTYTFCGNGCYPTVARNNYLDLELGNADRTLTSKKVPLANCAVSGIPPQVADFDGDGIPDIVVAEGPCEGSGTNTLNFLKGNGNGTFQSEKVLNSTSDSIDEVFVMRASKSGKPDLAVYQFQDVNRTITNPEELIMVNTSQ